MIKGKNLTKTAAMKIQAQADRNREFLNKALKNKAVDWQELLTILANNKMILEFAAAEVEACLPKINPKVEQLRMRALVASGIVTVQ